MVKPSKRRSSVRLQVLIKSSRVLVETLKLLSKEGVFPKKSRWVIAERIADLANNFHDYAHLANEIKVVTREDFLLRREYMVKSFSYLKTLAIKLDVSLDVLNISASHYEMIARMIKDLIPLFKSWITSDEHRYGSMFL